MEKLQKKENKFLNKGLKILFIFVSLIFVIPSIRYYLEKRTILNFDRYYQFLLNNTDITKQTIAYIVVLSIITVIYYLLLKNRKVIFKDIKNILIFVAIISIIFIVMIPFTSSDIFYYLGVGRLNSEYGQNPYYTTIKDFVEQENNNYYLVQDTVLQQGYHNPWSGTTVVYGPIWMMICKVVATLSLGNIDIGLLIFKIFNVLAHILNCYLIYKISHKKIFMLLYGLNPFVLIEGIGCVHNDIFVILFTLLSLYFLIKKKNILLSVIFIAIATAIKYFTILLLPFIIIYHFRQEKPSKRFLKCIQYGVVFLITVMTFYLVYIQDLKVLTGAFVQQEKLAKGLYVVLKEYFSDIPNIIEHTKEVLLGSFGIIYFFTCIMLLNKKEISFRKEMRIVTYFIMAFLFLLITNFQPWYIMWLFPCLIWQRADTIKLITGMSILSQFANSIFLMYEENWHYGTPFIFVLIVGSLIIALVNQERRKERLRCGYVRRKKIG